VSDFDPYRTPEQAARWRKRQQASAEFSATLAWLAAEMLEKPRRKPQPDDVVIPLRKSEERRPMTRHPRDPYRPEHTIEYPHHENADHLLDVASRMLDDSQFTCRSGSEWLERNTLDLCPEGHEDDEPWQTLLSAAAALLVAHDKLTDAQEQLDRVNGKRKAKR